MFWATAAGAPAENGCSNMTASQSEATSKCVASTSTVKGNRELRQNQMKKQDTVSQAVMAHREIMSHMESHMGTNAGTLDAMYSRVSDLLAAYHRLESQHAVAAPSTFCTPSPEKFLDCFETVSTHTFQLSKKFQVLCQFRHSHFR